MSELFKIEIISLQKFVILHSH